MDIERTKRFYRDLKRSNLCDCAYCRNYVNEVAKAYPAVTAYLQTLGVDIAKPFETMPLELDEDGRMPYIGPQYLVFGAEAGFAAATYQRGIPFVQVPTTLLAMVDSSVGGKTAIDLPEGKNLVGAFHQPAAVVCDPQLLDTLPPAILRDGCAEALKTAVLFDPDLFSLLAARGTDFDRMTVLPRCVACKRDAVCADEFDRGARQLLNLGHTAGHAIETLSGYRIAHGHAVAIGLAIMARAFCRDAAEIEAALIKLGLPTRTEFSPEQLAQAALADKKRAGERITLVIPRAIGDCVLREVPVDTLPDIFERGM